MQPKYILALLLPAIALIAITPTVFASNGAVHTGGSDCAMIDPATVTPNLAGTYKDVQTPGGNEHITCKTTITDYTGPAVRFDNANTGFLCAGIGGQWSTNWHEEINPNGKAVYECDLNPGSIVPAPES